MRLAPLALLLACSPHETAEIPPPTVASPPPSSETAPVPPTPPPTVAAIVRPDPPPTSPSLLDPMDPCLPRVTGVASSSDADVDRAELQGEVRWAKTRVELCCPRTAGSIQVVVTVGSGGAPTDVAVTPPKGAAPAVATCVKRLFSELRITPWRGAPVIAKGDLSTEKSAAP